MLVAGSLAALVVICLLLSMVSTPPDDRPLELAGERVQFLTHLVSAIVSFLLTVQMTI